MRLEYFQLIDRVAALDLKQRTIKVEAQVPVESTVFEGHFPGYPLMPGVLLIESMAQTSGWLIIGLMRFERMPFLAAVKEAKLRTFIRPGAKLEISAAIEHEGSGYAITKAAIAQDGKAVCDAEITFRVMPFPSPDFRKVMEHTATRIGFPTGALADG
jgi:3-hydroxyacyl-[acyl-carrier-protein] dehydratase